ncbi:hypothetical protein Zmor_019502 [Zophobas morio]|uniref:Uncharacterized protein n=1 Tax=Zophobas morio TaxID=2755281 RepID=A0AA38I3T5_9CUCU|nr:hypothetical protein Zmor_019502 [Zophobas morio]
MKLVGVKRGLAPLDMNEWTCNRPLRNSERCSLCLLIRDFHIDVNISSEIQIRAPRRRPLTQFRAGRDALFARCCSSGFLPELTAAEAKHGRRVRWLKFRLFLDGTVIMIALCTGELDVQVTKDLLRENGIKCSNDTPTHNQFFTMAFREAGGYFWTGT